MNRRQFISKSATALALSGLAGHQAFASMTSAPNKGRIGIQLYSVRNDLPKDFLGTLKKLSDIGYSQVELYGFNGDKFLDYSINDLRKVVEDLGMTISSTHTSSRMLPEDLNAPEWDFWKKRAEFLLSGGAKYAVQSSFPARGELTLDQLKGIATFFNNAGEICKRGGIKFGYHNHTDEFKKVGDEVILEYLIKNTDPGLVFFQLDMGHTVNGGGDCFQLLRTYPKRIPLWHASDFHAINKVYTLLGQGSVPYPALFELAESSGLELLTVEQENENNIFESCRSDFNYLKQFSWTQA